MDIKQKHLRIDRLYSRISTDIACQAGLPGGELTAARIRNLSVGGLKFSMDPTESIGKRITDMELKGKKLDPKKKYSVAGWASVARPLEGKPIWDVVEEYLVDKKTVGIKELNIPKIKGIKENPGLIL